jgi:hypothetical protein
LAIILVTGIKGRNDSINERPRVLNHVDVDENKARFRRFGIESVLEGADKAQVVIL